MNPPQHYAREGVAPLLYSLTHSQQVFEAHLSSLRACFPIGAIDYSWSDNQRACTRGRQEGVQETYNNFASLFCGRYGVLETPT